MSGIFGSGDTKKYTTTLTTNQDNRVAVGGSAGLLVSPGGALSSGGGAISAAPGASVTQTITGFGAGDVNRLLDNVFTAAQKQTDSLTDLAGSFASGFQASAQQLGDIVGTTRAPTQSALTALIPLGLLFVLALLWRKL